MLVRVFEHLLGGGATFEDLKVGIFTNILKLPFAR